MPLSTEPSSHAMLGPALHPVTMLLVFTVATQGSIMLLWIISHVPQQFHGI